MVSSVENMDLSEIREIAKMELSSLIQRLNDGGQKNCAFYVVQELLFYINSDKELRGLFCRENGVVGVFPLKDDAELVHADHAVFLVKTNVEFTRQLARILAVYTQKMPNTFLTVFFVPRKTLMIEHIFENEYQSLLNAARLNFSDFDWDIAVLDEDLLSMQMPDSFRQMVLDGDATIQEWSARMLFKLQASFFGAVPLIRAKGTNAAKVVNVLRRLQEETESDCTNDIASKFDSLFIFDRSLDLVTPTLTQLTYEGLIDELYSINAGIVSFPFKLSEESAKETDQQMYLSSSDQLFREIRDKNFSSVGNILYSKSIWVKQCYEKRKEVQELKELKEYMKTLPEMQELHRLICVHTNIATDIGKNTQSIGFQRRITIEQYIVQQINEKEVLNYIEELINKSAPITEVFRLISLYSLANDGLKSKTYEFFKHILMLSYGIPYVIVALTCFEKCGLITIHKDKPATFSSVRKQFKLWDYNLDEKSPSDVSYAYSGYAPLSLRLLNELITCPDTWGSSGTLCDILPGSKAEIRDEFHISGSPSSILVFFLGGVTLAEINAIRFLQKRWAELDQPKRIVIATTNVMNGTRMIRSLLPFAD
uniref:Putative vacuolar sorting protein n=1 Tax=Trypanosoma vivax (strain Y486) TaxID=1055687 RepID=G0TSP8_TRYVY|nr:putative vacuolar sorting protein [Trypanosoma vivax Y486]